MKKFILLFVSLFLFFTLLIVGYLVNVSKPSSVKGKIQVATSFYPLYFFATQIGGDKASVFSITPSSAEPHDYEPTAQDIARIEQSDLLVLNGGNLESWGNRIKDDLQNTHTHVTIAGGNLANKQITEDGKMVQDPHIWLDPILAREEVSRIEQGFELVDPSDARYFREHMNHLQDQLDHIDQLYRVGLSTCLQTDFVTSHAAFGYLSERYHIQQVAISGVSPDAEPSSAKLVEIADLVRRKHIGVIFFESLISPKLSQTIADETGARVMVLNPIEGITSEDMKAGYTYLTLMERNLESLRVALRCH